MVGILKTSIVALGLAGFACTLPVTAAEALPFSHKECKTTYRHHKKVVTCKRVVFRKHPVRKTLKEFMD